jgi:hypothetical protein
MEWINLGLAVSNLYAYRAIVTAYNKNLYALAVSTAVAAVASTLFHLSERKHHLPGIEPFRRITWTLLWCDRLAAYAAYAAGAVALYHLRSIREWIPAGGVAFVLMGISEWQSSPYIFFPFHLGWHVMAYHLLYLIAQTH